MRQALTALDLDVAKRNELIVLAAVVLGLLQVFARPIRERFLRSEQVAKSFLGGMSVSYVFLLLIPEIDRTTNVLGRRAPLLTLAGFIIFYGVEYLTRPLDARPAGAHRTATMFWIHAAFLWFYALLFVLTIPDDLHVAFTYFALALGAVAIKVSHHAAELYDQHPRLFSRWGRWFLGAAPLVGGVIDIAWEALSEVVVDSLSALVAGFIVLSAFRDALPRHHENDFRLFALGIALYVAIFFSQPLHVG